MPQLLNCISVTDIREGEQHLIQEAHRFYRTGDLLPAVPFHSLEELEEGHMQRLITHHLQKGDLDHIRRAAPTLYDISNLLCAAPAV